MMSLSPCDFETIVPYRYITFTLPNGQQDHQLQIAVLDYPSDAIYTAAMWVPPGRERDWIFSTFYGHLQLLISAHDPSHPLSRLILVGNVPTHGCPTSYKSSICSPSLTTLQQNLSPLLVALTPKSSISCYDKVSEVPWLVYEDHMTRSFVLEICEGPRAGEMLIENVELEIDGVKEFRRRLRFKRMPNLVQTEIRIHPKSNLSIVNLDNTEFELDMGVLVQPYLSSMVAGISVVSSFLENRILNGFRPKALCLGVGGGALLSCLSSRLSFEVLGVEDDEMVLEVAKKYFGLGINGPVHLFVEDAICFVENRASSMNKGSEFDVIMVDLDSSDATVGAFAPPVEFVRNSVLLAVRDLLHHEGVVIINTVPVKKSFYEKLIRSLREILAELYEVDVGNEENFVLIATKSKVETVSSSNEGIISSSLKLIVPRLCLDSIRKIPEK